MLDERQLDALTYPRVNLKDNTLDDNNLSTRCPLDNGAHSTGCSLHDLGSLDRVPLEILNLILIRLDLRTLTSFRRVNRRALSVLDQLREYRAIVTHAPNLLRGVLSIQSDQWVACDTLYNTLCNAQCVTCGDVGGYVYLVTGCRVCFLCLADDPSYLPVPFGRASRYFGVPFKALRSVPYMVSIRGLYSPNERILSKQQHLVDFKSLYEIVKRSTSRSCIRVWNEWYTETHHVSDSTDAAQPLSHRQNVLRIISAREKCKDAKSGNVLRFAAIVRAPFLDAASQTLKCGFFCVACKRSHVERPAHFRRQFTKSSFEAHLAQCHIDLLK